MGPALALLKNSWDRSPNRDLGWESHNPQPTQAQLQRLCHHLRELGGEQHPARVPAAPRPPAWRQAAAVSERERYPRADGLPKHADWSTQAAGDRPLLLIPRIV